MLPTYKGSKAAPKGYVAAKGFQAKGAAAKGWNDGFGYGAQMKGNGGFNNGFPGKAKGKGKEKGTSAPKSAPKENMSGMLQEHVNYHAETLMDLNTTEDDIRLQLEQILQIRADMLAGIQERQREKVEKPPRPSGPAGINLMWVHITNPNWKNMLQEHIQSEIARPVAKTDMTWETMVTESPEGKQFWGTLTCHCLVDDATGEAPVYASEEPCASDKEATQLAAKFALMNMRPDIYEEAERLHALWLQEGGVADEPAAKRYKPGSTLNVPTADPKSGVNHAAQLLLGRNFNKESVVYDTQPAEGGYVSAVSIPALDPEGWFGGELFEDKKKAEASAAQAFLDAYADIIAERKVEREAQTAERNRQKGKGKGAIS